MIEDMDSMEIVLDRGVVKLGVEDFDNINIHISIVHYFPGK